MRLLLINPKYPESFWSFKWAVDHILPAKRAINGRFRRYKIVDPSFHNWTGMTLALRNQAISDFPLCNKSFNLSYCGFDL